LASPACITSSPVANTSRTASGSLNCTIGGKPVTRIVTTLP
jgi:hypothetical protein